MLKLAADDWEAELLPAAGGAIAGLRHLGEDVLRRAPPGSIDPVEMASFPLVPYANRIARGRFVFAGRDIQLPPNFTDHPHPLHGVGWRTPWQVVEAQGSTATLRLTHRGGAGWLFAFTAEQHVALYDHGFEQTLTLRNDTDTVMPGGLGLHPYFIARPGTRLQARVEGAWLADDSQLLTRRVAPDHFGDWAAGDPVARTGLVDHCHDGWDGVANIKDAERSLRITATGARWLHLYLPPGEPFFCVEPVTHLPDAVNRPGEGMTMLAPGASMAMTLRIETS